MGLLDYLSRDDVPEDLKKELTQFNEVLNSINNKLYVFDVNDYKITLGNDSTMIGSACYAKTHNRDPPCEEACPIEIIKQTKKPVNLEHIHYDNNGEQRIFDVFASPIFDSEGNLAQVMEYNVDITEQRITEEKYHKLFKDANDLIHSVSLDGSFIDVNPAWTKTMGYTKEEALKLNVEDVIHPDYLKYCKNILKEIISGKSVTNIEAEFLTKDGRRIAVNGNASCNYKNGKPHTTWGVFRDIRDVNERKKMEKKLRESEEKYRLITESAGDLISIVDLKGEYTYISPSIKKYGFTPEELIGKSGFEYVHPEDKNRIVSKLTDYVTGKNGKIPELIDKNHSIQMTFRNMDKLGGWHHLEAHSSFIKEPESGKYKILTIARDVTERKNLEDKLRESREKYKLIFNNVTDLISIIDDKFKFEFINEGAFLKTFNYSIDDLIGKSCIKYIHPEDFTNVANALNDGIKKGEGETRFRFKHKNGEWIWIESKSSTFHDKNGKMKGLVVSRNVHERKKLEDKLKKSEKRYRSLFEKMPIGIALHEIITDDSGRPKDYGFLEVNDSFEKQTGLKREDIIGRKVTEILPGIENDPADWIRKYGEVALNGTEIRFEQFAEPLQRWYSISAFSPKKGRLVTVFEDITEKKQVLEEKIRVNNLKSDLIDFASHELKTPLIPIFGYTQLLYNAAIKGKNMNKVIEKYDYESLNDGVNRLVRVINNFIEVSSVESGRYNLVKEDVNLQEIINNSIEELSFSAELMKIDIENNCEEMNLPLDRDKIQQIFTNLINNSIRYSPQDTKVTINSSIKDDYFEVRIIDEGYGFTQDEKELAVQFFAKGHIEQEQKKSIQGTGLGLFLSNKIIKLHDGDLKIESEGPNKGATMIVRLPLKNNSEELPANEA